MKEWPLQDGQRYIVFLFKATQFQGDIKSGREGQIFWTTREALKAMPLPPTFKEMLPVFDDLQINELALGPSIAGERSLSWL